MERLSFLIKNSRCFALALSFSLVFTFSIGSGLAADKIVLRYGHVGPPGNPYYIGAEEFAKKVHEKTKGKVEIKVYPAGQLGQDRDLAEGVQLGTVDIAIPSNAVMTRYVPQAMVFELPFIFRDIQHWEKVVDGPIGKKIASYFEEKGFYVLAFYDGGWRGPYATQPIRKFDDFKGLKFRTMESQMHIAIYKALGARGVPMASSEQYSALQQGVIDGGDSPWVWYKQLNHCEVAKHLTTLRLFHLNNVHLMSTKVANKLNPELFDLIKEASHEARIYQTRVQQDIDTRLLKELQKEGVKIYIFSPEEQRKVVEAAKTVWKNYEKEIGKELIDAVVQTK